MSFANWSISFIQSAAQKSFKHPTVTKFYFVREHQLHGIVTGLEGVRIMASLEDRLDRLLVSFKDAKVRSLCLHTNLILTVSRSPSWNGQTLLTTSSPSLFTLMKEPRNWYATPNPIPPFLSQYSNFHIALPRLPTVPR